MFYFISHLPDQLATLATFTLKKKADGFIFQYHILKMKQGPQNYLWNIMKYLCISSDAVFEDQQTDFQPVVFSLNF